MATRDFLLPDLGEGLTEGEVVSWLVAVGDVVEVDQYVAEIETAKAVVEVPSPFGGTVAVLHAAPGEEVLVGNPLITIDVGGVDIAVAPGDLSSGDAPGTSISAEVESAAAADDQAMEDQAMEDQAMDEQAGDDQAGDAESESGSVLVGYGTSGGKGSRRRRVTAAGGSTESAASGPDLQMRGSGHDPGPESTAPQPVERDGRPLAKPPVRKMAKDLGVDLDYVAGSGEGGVITRADVQAAADGNSAEEATRAVAARAATDPSAMVASAAGAPSAGAPSASAVSAATGQAGETRIPFGQMRKAIAAQMGRSRREIPEAVTWVEADATKLWKLRGKLNAGRSHNDGQVKISPLALIMRMTVAALRAYPSLNATLDTENDEIVQYGHVNLGIAAQTPRGLVVPVIADAHTMNTVQLAQALNDKAATARAGKLTPTEMSGGTFTISNYGAFGVDGGDMVINHPEVAILGVGRILDKPWVVGGKVKVRKVITYSIAFDHRVCDGGEGAGFIRLLADMTEDPTALVANL